ncbi:MAG TPA: ABC transporter permease [Gemmatimonadales bacterium]|nr:ABC transporter permease [Gemmatimonadales bacterium]
MLSPRRILRRLRALLSREQLDRELDDEIHFHLEMDADAARRHGQEAPGRASLGNVPLVKDEVRDVRGVRPVEDFLADVRLAVRGLIRRPTFTLASLATFALGAGGVAAVFGAINGILLRPLPYPEPDRMVVVWEWNNSHSRQQEASPGNFLDWRERATAFEYLVAAEPYGLDWQSPDGPVYLSTWLVTENFFEAFGVKPMLGRTFRRDEHQQGRGRVVVLGWSKWQRQFGGDPNVIGRIITLDGSPWEIIGVMPRAFDAMDGNDLLWAPKVLTGWEPTARTSPFWTVVGRIKPGVTIEQGGADLRRVAAQLGAEYPRTNASIDAVLVPITEQVVGSARRALWLLLGAVGVLLMVAGANVTGLQLARALDRGREFAVRAALGATSHRMVRQLVTESFVLAGLGSLLGFALAFGGLGVIRRLAPPAVPRPDQLQADLPVLLVAIAVGLITALVSGLAPALSASRSNAALGLTMGGRAFTAGPLARRVRATLVGGQFAFALMLLVGAGLLFRSFVAILTQDRGFQSDHVLVTVTQAWGYFPTPEARAEYVRQASERLRQVPGVVAVGMTSSIPLNEFIGAETGLVAIAGQATGAADLPEVHAVIATGGYFDALRIPLRGGRVFSDNDRATTTAVAVVNDAFVRRFFPGESPIGRRITLGIARTPKTEREIIGVVADVRRHALHQEARPAVYVPHAQAPTGAAGFVIRTQADPDRMTEAVKGVFAGLSASMPVSKVTTMDRLVGESLRERRFLLTLLAGFALAGICLAATGIFGVMSYITGERTREIGVRMAFGADRARVLGMVLGDGTRIAGAGIVAGLLGALLTSRILTGMLYGVRALDPITFVGGALLLLAVGFAATWIPARRAAGLDPVEALRSE